MGKKAQRRRGGVARDQRKAIARQQRDASSVAADAGTSREMVQRFQRRFSGALGGELGDGTR